MLDQTYKGAVRRQIAYGAERGVPWGVSESAYNVRDRHHTYQYRAFGVPDLALKRGLGRDLVIAPYASALAAMVEPQRALANLGALEQQGALGRYGFRDALDYTRPDPGQPLRAWCSTFMAHHVGMSLVALTNALDGAASGSAGSTPIRWCARRSCCCTSGSRAGSCCRSRRQPAPTRRCPSPSSSGRSVREVDTPDTPQPHVALLGHLPYTDHGEPLRRGLQPLRGARGHPLARRRRPATTPASSAT